MTTTELPPARPLPAHRTEVVGDGISTASLITSWVGFTVPLLPAVTLLVALAGRRRAATRWLNTVAIVVAAVFLAAQVVIAAAFGATLVSVVQNLTNREQQSSSELTDFGSGDALLDPSASESTASTPSDDEVGFEPGDGDGTDISSQLGDPSTWTSAQCQEAAMNDWAVQCR